MKEIKAEGRDKFVLTTTETGFQRDDSDQEDEDEVEQQSSGDQADVLSEKHYEDPDPVGGP